MPAPLSRTDSTLVIGLGRFGSAVAATQHLAPQPVQGGGYGGTEASQPDDERGVGARGRGGHEVS